MNDRTEDRVICTVFGLVTAGISVAFPPAAPSLAPWSVALLGYGLTGNGMVGGVGQQAANQHYQRVAENREIAVRYERHRAIQNGEIPAPIPPNNNDGSCTIL